MCRQLEALVVKFRVNTLQGVGLLNQVGHLNLQNQAAANNTATQLQKLIPDYPKNYATAPTG